MNKYVIFKKLYDIHQFFGWKPTLLAYAKRIYNKPQTLQLHPNHECNFKCKYCYAETPNTDCLDYSTLKRIIKEAKQLGVGNVDILGGEPLLYPHFEEMVSYIGSLGMQATIFTNGTNITEDLLKRLDKKYTSFVIKTDTKKNYVFQNEPDMSYDELLKKIELVKKHDFNLMSFTVITKRNVWDIQEILDLADKYDMSPAFERYHLVKEPEINALFALTKKQWSFFLKELSRYWTEKGFKNFIEFYAEVNGGMCTALTTDITIMQDGTVKACPETDDDLSYGNAKTDSLKNIWKKSKEFRKQLNKTPDECSHCSGASRCHGGCKVYTYNLTKDLNKRDPLCSGEFNPNYSHCGFGIIRIKNEYKKT